jgi:cytochrome b involved in lipid metabolism
MNITTMSSFIDQLKNMLSSKTSDDIKPTDNSKETPNPDIKKFTKEDVAKHDKKDDCWIIIDNNVCDITKFLDEHPGGPQILIMYAGKDCTEDFVDIGHSNDAIELMKKYKIGEIDEPKTKN